MAFFGENMAFSVKKWPRGKVVGGWVIDNMEHDPSKVVGVGGGRVNTRSTTQVKRGGVGGKRR